VIVDKIWISTNTVRVGLTPRSTPTHRQETFPDNVCSYSPLSRCHYSRGHTGSTRSGQTWKKPKDLSTREREESGCVEGGDVYVER
jgi:hypothetical protein